MASGPKQFHANTNVARLGLTAALLAVTAGAPAALGQFDDEPADPQGLSDFLAETGAEALGGVDLDALQAEADAAINATEDEFFVELHVNDEDLANVLQMLSIQSQRNIIASNNVSATVTANLYGVTFYEALDAILHVNGFGYLERGSFIYVYTLDELQQIRNAQRQRVIEVIKLNYLTATDAAEFAAPMLSADGGQIKMNGATEDFSIPDDAPVGADTYAHDAVLVVYDYEENIDAIRSLIDQIDTRPAQVLVEATILQTNVTEANAFGVDFSIIANLDFEDFIGLGGPLSTTSGLFDGVGEDANGNSIPLDPGNALQSSVGSNVANIGGPATFQAGVLANNAAVFVRMLDEVSDTTILSNPKVLSLNRQPARVLVGRKVGFLSTTSTETSTTQTVEFLDTGTQLYFRPFITEDGMIRLELKPQVSEAVIREQTDATGAAVTIPDEITNEITANVLVRDGQTVVLGGLFRESTSLSRRQVPVLGDLPLIGGAFRGREDDVDKTEIVFMVTPSVVNDEVLTDMGERGAEFADAARVGAREGLLPFSREKRTAQLLVEAEDAARSGNTKKAMHKLRRAAAMDPTRAGLYVMQRDLGGEVTDWPAGSILEGIVGNEAALMSRSVFDNNQGLMRDEFSIESVSTGPVEMEFQSVEVFDDSAFSDEDIVIEQLENDDFEDGAEDGDVLITNVEDEPAFDEQNFEEPVSVEGDFEEPGFEISDFEDEGFEAPVVEEPVFEEPVFIEPTVVEPEAEVIWDDESDFVEPEIVTPDFSEDIADEQFFSDTESFEPETTEPSVTIIEDGFEDAEFVPEFSESEPFTEPDFVEPEFVEPDFVDPEFADPEFAEFEMIEPATQDDFGNGFDEQFDTQFDDQFDADFVEPDFSGAFSTEDLIEADVEAGIVDASGTSFGSTVEGSTMPVVESADGFNAFGEEPEFVAPDAEFQNGFNLFDVDSELNTSGDNGFAEVEPVETLPEVEPVETPSNTENNEANTSTEAKKNAENTNTSGNNQNKPKND
ncbi:MAG: secretin N-terminal domain-containing protein [Planctomycetota bacterium]